MQDARCIATIVDPVMAQLKALAPLNILFSWDRIPSLSEILSPAKNWALEKPTCRLYPKRISDKRYKQSITIHSV